MGGVLPVRPHTKLGAAPRAHPASPGGAVYAGRGPPARGTGRTGPSGEGSAVPAASWTLLARRELQSCRSLSRSHTQNLLPPAQPTPAASTEQGLWG